MSRAHDAVMHELLVRCLDAWTPAALHGASRASYLHGAGTGPVAAEVSADVFHEFADLLSQQELRVVQIGGGSFAAALPDAAQRVERDRLADPADARVPVFAALTGVLDAADLRWLGADKRADVLWFDAPAGARGPAGAAGFGFVLDVDLVDQQDRVVKLLFLTHQAKTLERAKEALWAVDDHAGIRYRDPADPTGTPIEIALTPMLRPLVAALASELSTRARLTVAQLKEFTLTHTAFRAADALRAAAALIQSGEATREPPGGRLTPQTTLIATAATGRLGSRTSLPKAG